MDIRQAAFGPDHPETAESLGKLATLHAANNDIKTAVLLYAQGNTASSVCLSFKCLLELPLIGWYPVALASLEKTFGSDHLALCEFLDKTAELAQVRSGRRLGRRLGVVA